jgi:hypothetical protein
VEFLHRPGSCQYYSFGWGSAGWRSNQPKALLLKKTLCRNVHVSNEREAQQKSDF